MFLDLVSSIIFSMVMVDLPSVLTICNNQASGLGQVLDFEALRSPSRHKETRTFNYVKSQIGRLLLAPNNFTLTTNTIAAWSMSYFAQYATEWINLLVETTTNGVIHSVLYCVKL